MPNNNKCKRKVLTQRHVCSRMNFLYQAANLMAHNKNNTLAAYYGRLCRNVGTKALMHMSPAIKRTLCKRCSLPLLPGVNTTLKLGEKPNQQQEEQEEQEEQEKINQQKQKETNLSVVREPTFKTNKRSKKKRAANVAVPNNIIDNNVQLYLECSLCQAKRRFKVSTTNECWLERPDAIVQTVSLDQASGNDEGIKEDKNIT